MKGKPQKAAARAKRPAAQDEILKAIEALSDADTERLEQFAQNRIYRIGRGAVGRNYEDLLHDAMIRLLEGFRHWYPDEGVTFVQCLMGVIRSLSSGWAGHRKRNLDSPEYAALESEKSIRNNEGQLTSPFETIRDKEANVEEGAIDAEAERARLADCKALAEAITADFAEDEPASLVLMGFEDGMDGPTIRSTFDMTEPQFRTVTRRIQRRARKIMEDFYGK
jgi:hypothetical protein